MSTDETTSQAAALLGRKGGKSTSEAKRVASRENGKRGGRPIKLSGNTRLTRERMNQTKWLQAVSAYVAENSKHGNPDDSVDYWLSVGDYSDAPTLASVVAEWDNGRD
jgi:hypothetical protein